MTIVEDRTPTRTVAADFAVARRAMIDSQLRPSGVSAPWVLERMAELPREDFVPPARRAVAYMDRAVPLAGGRWLAPATVHGLMVQEARPRADDRVLVVDGGSGYLPTLIRPLAGSVEVIGVEAASAGTVAADGAGGGYTLLLVDGAAEQLPAPLLATLAPGARIVTGLVESGVTRLAAGQAVDGRAALLPLMEIGIPVLPEFAAPRVWSF
ncbi:protein-L-isoaspartate O-methyltransferase [Croceibacterium mercuriale]|uniref:Protein-L-isoaspartate O-methyltransferase n=1 Tax=Croceibacterium mercuriale TaxID=1572751 RepID=A0A0B2BXN4_9SPHN|nr:protein-L-isoaspartate O-methyltransferase [Croceibacterium mercuriale]KHL24732.1 protein-L-isoaspartate O-methyltransferase [Croceibacterium mercuriale]